MSEPKLLHIGVGPARVALTVDGDSYERVRSNTAFRYLVKPAAKLLLGGNGHANGHLTPTPPPAQPTTAEGRALAERIAGYEWYHSIDLPYGVSTPGYVDHRSQVALYGLPQDMRGMRALDVATYDGFWAFEMERRGAEVVAIDIPSLSMCDYPRRFRHHALESVKGQETGKPFRLAKEILESKVQYELLNVYELSPERVGLFDVVFISDTLLHLRDPALALDNMAGVTRVGGMGIIAEPFNTRLEPSQGVPLTEFGFEKAVGWWQPSISALKSQMWAGGFDEITEVSRFQLICNASIPLIKVVLHGRRRLED